MSIPASPQVVALMSALRNIRLMNKKLARSEGLTEEVFSTAGDLPDEDQDNARKAVAIEFQALVQNIRSVKSRDPIIKSFPDIHYRLSDQIARRNWVVCEYGTTVPIRWGDIAQSIWNDVPKIQGAIIAALKASGVPIP